MRSSRYICSPISSMNSTVGVSKSGCSGVPIAEQSSERLPPASRPRAVPETLSGCAAASMRVQRPKSALRNDSSETIASGFSSAPKRNLPGIVA